MALPRPRAVLFDFGDTLLREGALDLEAGVRAALALAHNPREVSVATVLAALDELSRDLFPRREASQLELSPLTVQRLVYEPLGIAFDRLPEEVELAFWRAGARFTVEPGIEAVLQRLRDHGVRLAVVSNTMFRSGTVAWEIGGAGLLGFFEFVMTSGDYVVRKPHPAIFRVAAAKLNLAPEDVWFAGNSAVHDIAGAAGVGMPTVWYNRAGARSPDPPPTFAIATWEDFLAILDRHG